MKLHSHTVDYIETIEKAKILTGNYDGPPVTFHCYWSGPLTEKQMMSIGSCFAFHGGKHKIILWVERNKPNGYNDIIEQWAEIRPFHYQRESEDVKDLFGNYNYTSKFPAFYADLVRYLLLYKYGGCWFDLDIMFLRSFDPIFCKYEHEVCVYQWEEQPHPNNAIYISLNPFSDVLKKLIFYIRNFKKDWGFRNAGLTYDLPVDLLVLPCSWFDAGWIKNPEQMVFTDFFKHTEKEYNLDNFFQGAFCFHWHNQWNDKVETHSPASQLWSHICVLYGAKLGNMDKMLKLS